MNERIQELKKQASSYASTKSKEAEEWRWIYEEKFAELIVRECIFAVEDAGGINKYHYTKAISKHFGVGE